MTNIFAKRYFIHCLITLAYNQFLKKGERTTYVPYSCRHYFSNLLKNTSGADKDKAAFIGHADYETTKRVYQSVRGFGDHAENR